MWIVTPSFRDPLKKVKRQIEKELKQAIDSLFPSVKVDIPLKRPPRKEFGELSSPVSFSIAKQRGEESIAKKATDISKKILCHLELEKLPLLSDIEATQGHINFFLNWEEFSKNVLTDILDTKENFGKNNIGNNRKIVVEHTSANPVHPLHIGTARNSVIGDSLVRLLQASNYKTQVRYFQNDVGKQVAYLAYGYQKIKDEVQTRGKIDHFFGIVYSCTVSVIEEKKLRKELQKAKEAYIYLLTSAYEKVERLQEPQTPVEKKISSKLQSLLSSKTTKVEDLPTADWRKDAKNVYTTVKEMLASLDDKNVSKPITQLMDTLIAPETGRGLNDVLDVLRRVEKWSSIANKIRWKWPEIYEKIEMKLVNGEKAEEKVGKIAKKYEQGEEKLKQTIREICKRTLSGIEETLSQMGISFDIIDWESEIVWKGRVKEILKSLETQHWVVKKENHALELDIQRALEEKETVRKIFGMAKTEVETLIQEGKFRELPPNLMLLRGDGSTLYPTRDVAYSLLKFQQDPPPSRVLNVIGNPQTLIQKEVAAALHLAGFKEFAKNLEHVSYEWVRLPEHSMSARKGRYKTLDELLEEAKALAYQEVNKRSEVPQADIEEVAQKIAVGAIRYFLLSVDPKKVLTFRWDEVMDFKRNSGPFVQYSYARATSILDRSGQREHIQLNDDYQVVTEESERALLFELSKFPEKVKEATINRLPNLIAEYCNELASIFHSFYEHCPVLTAKTEKQKMGRLLLVKAYVQVLRNALRLVGVPALEHM